MEKKIFGLNMKFEICFFFLYIGDEIRPVETFGFSGIFGVLLGKYQTLDIGNGLIGC